MPLGAKVRVPEARRSSITRTRLPNPFLSRGALPRLVLIAAPPGFGKTTLLTQWLGDLGGPEGGCQVAWLSLDESDAEERQFLADLVEALDVAGQVATGEARALLATGEPLAAEQVVASILNELDVAAGTTVIALDDLHRAAGPGVHEALAFLIENLPPQVVVAITTRADPPLPLARLRARGELVEVRAADLRFTPEEATGFLRTVMGLELDAAQVEALDAKTEGWVAGLQLAALSVRARAGSPEAVDAFIRAFGGSHRFVLDYLVEEVLDAQPAGARDFLLQTSVLERMTAAICDAVTGRSDGQWQLEQLEAANAFVTALDDERRWFRYHQLFAEVLRARLVAEQPDRLPALHRAASRAYAATGLLDDALRQAVLSRDADWAADLIECALPMVRHGRGDRSLVAWMAGLPDDLVRRRPVLATTRAWSRLTAGDLAGAATWLGIADAASAGGVPAAAPPSDLPAALVAIRDAERRAVPASIAIYRAALAQASGDVAGTIRQAEIAAAAAPDDHFVQGAAEGFIGLAAWAEGDLRRAVPTFRSAVAHMGAAGNVTDQLGSTVVLADLALADGRPDHARTLFEDALDAARRTPEAATTVLGDLHTGLAGVLTELDDLDAAAGHLTEAWELGESASLQENRFRWHRVHAGLLRAAGSYDAALAELDVAESRYLPGFFPDVRPLPAVRARCLIAAGRVGEARHWADSTGAHRLDPTRYLDEFVVLTYARLVIAEHPARADLDEVLALIGAVQRAAEAARRAGSILEAGVVRALALSAAGSRQQANAVLREALLAAARSGHARVFLDEGAPLADLLRDQAGAPGGGEAAAWARRLLERNRNGSPQPPLRLGDEPLSDRELDVLRLFAGDLSGPEIAARLYISINTLRTHSRHIFTKLQATTRRAAVARARERNLL